MYMIPLQIFYIQSCEGLSVVHTAPYLMYAGYALASGNPAQSRV